MADAGQGEQPSAQENPGAEQSQQPQTQPKFLGKYTTIEEAERGYKELERFAYDQSRQAADTRKQLEQLAASQVPGSTYGYVPVQNAAGLGYNIDPRQEAELQDFYANPLNHLRRRDENVRQQTAAEIRREMRAELNARDTLSAWKADNPDLLRHEPLVATFVAQQPAHLSVREKLDRAAEEARRYRDSELAKNGPARQTPQLGQFVESPGGGVGASVRDLEHQDQVSQEGELADFVKERNAWKDKRMTTRQ